MYAIRGINLDDFNKTAKLPPDEFYLYKIPPSSLKLSQWKRLTNEMEKFLGMPVTPQRDIVDGSTLSSVINESDKFDNRAHYNFNSSRDGIFVIGGKDGMLTTSTYNNVDEHNQRLVHDPDSIGDNEIIFIDPSVVKYMDKAVKITSAKRPASNDTIFESLESESKKHEGAVIPDKIREQLTDLSITGDTEQALQRAIDILSKEKEEQANESRIQRENLERRLAEKDKQIVQLGEECDKQIEESASFNEQTSKMEKDRLKSQLEESKKKLDDCQTHLPGVSKVEYHPSQNFQYDEEFIADILAEKERIDKIVESNQWKERAGFGDEDMVEASGSTDLIVRPGMIVSDMRPYATEPVNTKNLEANRQSMIKIATAGQAKGSGWDKHKENFLKETQPAQLQNIPEQQSSEEEEMEVSLRNKSETNKTSPLAPMLFQMEKLPNLSKLGIQVWDESRISIIEHLSDLLTNFEFKLKDIAEATKKACVSQSLPMSYNWIYSHLTSTDMATANSLIHGIAKLLIGGDTKIADALFAVTKRTDEDPLGYHSRLAKMCEFIDGNEKKMSYQIVRGKIEAILSHEAKNEFRRRLSYITNDNEKTVMRIGKELIALRNFLGKERMMAGEKPPKEWSEEISMMNKFNRPNKKFQNKKKAKVGKCYECGETGHWKRECPSLKGKTNGKWNGNKQRKK